MTTIAWSKPIRMAIRGSDSRRRFLLGFAALPLAWTQAADADAETDRVAMWVEQFTREVDYLLDVPVPAQQRYIAMLRKSLAEGGHPDPVAQSFVGVDRSAHVQAAFVILKAPVGSWNWIGATSVSTGKTGSFDHFLTPLGVFPHALDAPDFRALGTLNQNRIRGYGVRGRRVFDFGWQLAERGWGKGGTSKMRLQMHATDPHVLEGRLGGVASEGCIRIPAKLNVFLDRHGILDADYEQAQAGGDVQWILKPDRQTIDWPGRFMVIVDSQSLVRPAWSRPPGAGSQPMGAPALPPMTAA
ncbi:MAG: murein L,D-transpeptidase [Caldimonas sp.]